MHAELKGLDSADAPAHDIAAYTPADAGHFGLNVTASIGPAGEEGAELFSFTVCSASWLKAQSLQKGFVFQRHTLLLERWDPDLVQRSLSDLCLRTEGESWHEVAVKLSRFGRWEFEDYRE